MIETLNTLAPLGINRPTAYVPTGPDDDYWYQPVSGGGSMPVTALSALQISAVFACHRILSGDIAKTPIGVFRRTADGREPAPTHYLNRLLSKQANPYMSARRFRALMQNWVLSNGNAYAQMDVNARGQVTAFWPWRPDRVTVKPAPNFDGYIYEYRLKNGEKLTQPWVNMLHLRGLEVDGVMGLNPIQSCRRTFDLALSQDEYSISFYKNGARPGGILSGPFQGKDKDEIRKEWNESMGGVGNTNKTAVFATGTTWAPIAAISQSDSEFIATRKMGVADFSRIYGVPLHKLAELDRATFSNIEEQGLEYEASSFGDWASNWESELMFSCLSERDADTIFVEFDRDEMRRGRLSETMTALSTAVNSGIMDRDEGRTRLHLNRRKGNAGKLMVQVQNVPIDSISDAPVTPKPVQGPPQ
jgi:HK97 family phage portal protein